uniref:LAGLIDADG endonuclease n=1 Tax=Synchytrium endobioticum TaxID=286115 RepID=A0A4P8NV00_9FUNG|nr:LAGLIDADG endonuclease [Synchytrium endobioticum]QCQ68553.1 LAGLIDADG endonuclease [Synchytrium endobioticum]QCQ68667.1 LAGLIDADG endonuclease [Synchytrium endobioticum]QCQ68686.1 LAGLIDADG endonuclease [Synchytrium endobioticum]QCQ68705.1 LAGLIDADG endonuclease [Synchytrium endobioticum]
MGKIRQNIFCPAGLGEKSVTTRGTKFEIRPNGHHSFVLLDSVSRIQNPVMVNPNPFWRYAPHAGGSALVSRYPQVNSVSILSRIPGGQKTILQRLNVRMISTMTRLTKQNREEFNQWLVGLTEGDGSFIIDRQRQNNGASPKWNITFQLSQKDTNAQLLYYIKNMLKYGQVSKSKDGNWSFRIRDKEIINKVIFPIFDKYPLLTVKYSDYILFKKAYYVLTSNLNNALCPQLRSAESAQLLLSNSPTLHGDNPNGLACGDGKGLNKQANCDLACRIEINRELARQMEEILKFYRKGPDINYISPIWANLYRLKNAEAEANFNNLSRSDITFVTKFWLIGFWEAEGSFYITNKDADAKRYTHGLGLTLKYDRQILEAIRLIMNADAKVKVNPRHIKCSGAGKADFYAWDSTSKSVCKYAMTYFEGKFIGRASLRFAIWCRSMDKDLKTLVKAQKMLRHLRLK